MQEIIVVIVSASVGGFVAFLGAIWQMNTSTRQYIHEKVHESRARLYPQAWQLTGVLPRRPVTQAVTYGDLTELSISLREWYYSEGGIYLSGGARRSYSHCQDILEEVRTKGADIDELVEEDYEKVRDACSYFRTWLTRDLLSRSRAPMAKKWSHEQR